MKVRTAYLMKTLWLWALLCLVFQTSVLNAWVNPGFETGTLAGWTSGTFGPGTTFPARVTVVGPGAAPHTQGTVCVAPAICLNQVHGGNYAVQLDSGFGDANHVDYSRIQQSDVVPAANTCLSFWLAAVLEGYHYNQGAGYNSDAYVEVNVLVGGAVIYTQRYSFYDNLNLLVNDGASPTGGPEAVSDDAQHDMIWKHLPWTQFYFNMSAYVGQTATVQFIAYDCDLGGHNSWGYIDDLAWSSCPVPVLSLQKSVSPMGAVKVGNTLTYTLSYANQGSSGIDGVTVCDTIPAGTTLLTALVSSSPTIPVVSWTGTSAGSEICWDIGYLPPASSGAFSSGSLAFSVKVNTPPAGVCNEAITNTAQETDFSPESVSSNAVTNTVSVCSPTFTLTVTRTETPTRTVTPTDTPTDTQTVTVTDTDTRTVTLTATPTYTQTVTATDTSTRTDTPTVTVTDTQSVTATDTDTRTDTATITMTDTQTVTATDTSTFTVTLTDTPTNTQTTTSSSTDTRTCTSTDTLTSTRTMTSTSTLTVSPTDSATTTQTSTTTDTPTSTVTLTASATKTPLPPGMYSIDIKVYNSAGEVVAVLATNLSVSSYPSGVVTQAGGAFIPDIGQVGTFTLQGLSMTLAWDGTNSSGQFVSSGAYTISVITTDQYGRVTTLSTVEQVLRQPVGYLVQIYNNAGELVREWDLRDGNWRLALQGNGTVDQGGIALMALPSGAELIWDGTSALGQPVSQGVYILKVERDDGSGQTVSTRQVMLLRRGAPAVRRPYAAPNPVPAGASAVVIFLGSLNPEGSVRAELYSLSGSLVANAALESAGSELRLPLGHAAAGIYIASVEWVSGNAVLERRLVKVAVLR